MISMTGAKRRQRCAVTHVHVNGVRWRILGHEAVDGQRVVDSLRSLQLLLDRRAHTLPFAV